MPTGAVLMVSTGCRKVDDEYEWYILYRDEMVLEQTFDDVCLPEKWVST